MKRLRRRLIPAVVVVLMAFALSANLAAADEGDSGLDVVPYDPGMPGDQLPPWAPSPWDLISE